LKLTGELPRNLIYALRVFHLTKFEYEDGLIDLLKRDQRTCEPLPLLSLERPQ